MVRYKGLTQTFCIASVAILAFVKSQGLHGTGSKRSQIAHLIERLATETDHEPVATEGTTPALEHQRAPRRRIIGGELRAMPV